MTIHVAYLMNWPDAFPGHLERIVTLLGGELVTFNAYDGDVPDVTKFDLVIIGGSPMNPTSQNSAVRAQIEQIKIAFEERIPTLGICFGFQLMTLAAGGRVEYSRSPEWGMFDALRRPFRVNLTRAGRRDSLFKGLKQKSIRVFQMHQLMCILKGVPNVQILGKGRYCYAQAAKFGSVAYGFQNHIEFDEKMMKRFMEKGHPFSELVPEDTEAKFKTFYNIYYAFALHVMVVLMAIAEERRHQRV